MFLAENKEVCPDCYQKYCNTSQIAIRVIELEQAVERLETRVRELENPREAVFTLTPSDPSLYTSSNTPTFTPRDLCQSTPIDAPCAEDENL
jgi:hypothetical protein